MNKKLSFLDTLFNFFSIIMYILVSFSYLTFFPFLIIFLLIYIFEIFVKINMLASVVTYFGSMLLIVIFFEFLIVIICLNALAYHLLNPSLIILEWCIEKRKSLLFDINISLFRTFLKNAMDSSPLFLAIPYRKNLNYLRDKLIEFKNSGVKTDRKSVVLLRNQLRNFEVPALDRTKNVDMPIKYGLYYWVSLMPLGVLRDSCVNGVSYLFSRVIKPGAEDALKIFVRYIVLAVLILFGLRLIGQISPETSESILNILRLILTP